ncbi:TetR/AcrR family transcriptional regulator [Actinocrispum sp. NPDC049592]|uniref:TetR/AcrR family transcriptional regulator n=1 Tax=Actinocrispum sp. NPDC049592 TaxID=3154835 RepID=UPI00341E43A7
MDTRERLLQAAAQEFALHGPKGTRIREIVARSGVNERMIYHHFGSKEGLYKAVLEHEFTGSTDVWAQTLKQAAGLEPYEGLQLAFRAMFDLLHARPLLVALASQEAVGGFGVRPKVPTDGISAELRGLHERGVAQGVFRADVDFVVFYATMVSSLVAVPGMGRHFTGLADRDMTQVRDQVVALVLDGLTGER